MVFAWILLFMIGITLEASKLYWAVWCLGVVYTVLKYALEHAPEMEDEI